MQDFVNNLKTHCNDISYTVKESILKSIIKESVTTETMDTYTLRVCKQLENLCDGLFYTPKKKYAYITVNNRREC